VKRRSAETRTDRFRERQWSGTGGFGLLELMADLLCHLYDGFQMSCPAPG